MSDFIVRAKLIISGDSYNPFEEAESLPGFEKKWYKGDLIHPDRPRKYTDTGFSFILLDETSNPDWVEDLVLHLRKFVPPLQNLVDLSSLPVPLVSIYVDTDGERFPPLYLSRDLMELVQALGAEVDIDVIATLD